MSDINIEIDHHDISFNQLKGYANSRASEHLINTVKKFLEKNKIKFGNDNYFSVDLQPDITLIKKMPDYLSEEEIKRIKNNKITGRITKENSTLSQEQMIHVIEKFKSDSISI